MQPHADLDRLGTFIMRHLRDEVISHADGLLAGRWTAQRSVDLQTTLKTLSNDQREAVHAAIINSADAGIHAFLFALQDKHEKQGIAITIDGKDAVPMSDGIHGEPYGEDGWIARLSKYGRDA